jgi:hypothetical protein
MMRQFRFLVIAAIFVLLLPAAQTAAQSTSGSIRGAVTDPQGAVMPGVTVLAISDALVAGQQAAVTSAQGVYSFPSLPVGSYVLEAHMPGFQSVKRENVRVSLGQDIEVNLQLGDVTISEEIVVIAEAVQVSTVDNNVAFNLGEDFIQRQPLSRDPVNLMNYAPGIENDQAYGAPSTYQNAYNFDGVDVSDPEIGSQWVLPSMDWVEEVQVTGLGADAEYGGFTGAVVNVVTKSGSNTFHGNVAAYYSGSGLNSDNTVEGTEGANKVDSYLDVSASFGGPIARDKVWYFVSGNWNEEVIEPFFASGAPADDREQNSETRNTVIGKLTWQLNPSNQLILMGDYDGKEEDYRGIGDTVLASGSFRQDSPSYLFNATWESLVNNNNFLTAKVTGYRGEDDRLPYNGDTQNHYDVESGFDWFNYFRTSLKDVERTTLDASWSLFADGLITGGDSHNFKFGVVYEESGLDWETHNNGGFWYYDDSYYCDSLDAYFDDPFCGIYSSTFGGEWNLHADIDGLHVYAQDSWTVGRVTLNLGVRYTSYTGNFSDPVSAPTNGSSDVYSEDMWAPRVGFVWDLFGTGRSALKFHYGQYYDGMTVTLFDREASGEALSDEEYYDYNFDTGEFDIPAGGNVQAFANMDPDIKHPYVEQFVATYEHQLGSDMVAGVDYIRRKNKNINAMVVSNLDDYDALVAPDNPFGGGDLPFFELLDEQQNLITNPDIATREYESVALLLRKRYSHGWALDGSLVWSDSTGTADYSYNGYNENAGPDFEDLNGFVNADGTLPFNSEWVFKVSGSVDLPWKILLSGFYQYRTGEYWTPYAVIEGLYFNDRSEIFMTPRGTEQYDDRSVLDLKLQKDFNIGESLVLGIFVDAFNVLDSDKVTEVNEQWGWYVYDYQDHPDGSFWDPSSRYQNPERIQTPREIRIGAKLSW